MQKEWINELILAKPIGEGVNLVKNTVRRILPKDR